MAYLNQSHSGGLGIGGRLYDSWQTYRGQAQTRSAYRETVRQLSGLSDRELEDIGVTRHDIERAAHEQTRKR